MKVSVIIPVYNTLYEDLLQCIDSIIGQTFTDFEIIIVDDGSSQEYRKFLNKLQAYDSRIKIFHKENEGVSVARNFGVAQAQGEYILFADADDLLTPWLLESGVSVIEREKCDVVIGKIITTSERPASFSAKASKADFELLDTESKKAELEEHIFAKNCKRWQCDDEGWEFNGEGCWAHLLRKKVAMEIPFIQGVSVGEDTIWALTMLKDKYNLRIGMLSQPWYYYIQNNYSVLNKYNPRIVEQLTKPVMILDSIYGKKTGNIYDAYTDWILIKLKQICYRAYLAEENKDTLPKKNKDLSIVLHNEPWKTIIERGQDWSLLKKIKFYLYKHNLMLYLYVVVRCVRNVMRDSSLGENNENKS